jgi:hypothetical protein
MEEIWENIPAYEGLYKVSNLGRIKSILTDKYLKPSPDRFGYVRFNVFKNKKPKTLRIHRLVMEIFNPITNKMQVNHIDGNKSNNRLDRLNIDPMYLHIIK